MSCGFFSFLVIKYVYKHGFGLLLFSDIDGSFIENLFDQDGKSLLI